MRRTFLGWLLFVYATFIGQYTCANILDVTCINFNPTYNSTASFAAILNGADITSELSFQRSLDLNSGVRSSSWCSQGEDDLTQCGLPQGSTIDSTGKITFPDTPTNIFGVYGCRAERYNWTTESSTIFIKDDAHFNPEYFTVTVSLDEEVRLLMNVGSSGGSGSLVWKLNQESGGQTDLTFDLSGNELYISKANKDTHAGIHHYYYANEPDQGGLARLIVRACLDNLWGPDCQYTCPTCYNGGVCDDVTGRCICSPGFSGDKCGTACSAGMFGQDCSRSCSTLESSRTDCRGAVFCLPDPYGCSCAAGWTGLSCDQACPADMYGAGCTQTCHCDSSGSCDSATGACSDGCEVGWTGDQCQVTILDIIALLRRGGVDDTNNDNFLGIFMIGDSTVTSDASLKYYIGREVDTGPGETGHGASLQIDSGAMTTDWTDTGLPPTTTFNKFTTPAQNSYRSFISTGGDARVGAYRMSINYKGFTERNTLLNEYRGDMNSEVWPDKLTTTVGVGETVTLNVSTSVDTALLRWRHNGGSVITEWNGMTSVTINDVRKSDDGIYECHVSNNRETGKHAILRLIVRGCPSAKFGFNCSQDCPVCYAGGVCHDVTGECVCRAGFMGDKCQTPCSNNLWGRTCTVKCSTGGTCVSRLFSPPNPVGIACMNGFSGNRCQTACSGNKFGANCELDCNCDGGTCSHNNACPSGQCTSDYEGPYCQTLSANLLCQPGYFGTLCKYPCHCDGGVNCERTTGYCPNDDCAEGWAGSDCQQALPRLMETPIVTDITNDSVLIVWNAWTDGYDYGNGPVHSYQIDYSWTDDTGIEGSEEPVNITGDSTAFITGLFGFRDYEFYVSVRREVEDQIVPGVRSGPLTAKTLCGAPLLAPEIQSTTVDGFDNITVIWMIPQVPSSSWLQCDSSVYSYRLTYWPIDDPTDSIILPVEGSEDIREQPIDGLEPCTEYQFSVVVVNSIDLAGPADESTATTDKILPETPLAPVMTDRSTTSISIEFGHVDDTELGIYKISSYDLSAVDGQTTGDGELMSITNLTSPIAVVIGDLSPGTEYYIKVRAVNEGGYGDWSEILTESTKEEKNNTGRIVGLSLGVPIILIILVSSGFMLYKKRREAPPTPPKEFDLEVNGSNGGASNPTLTTTTVTTTPKVKPAIKERPPQYQPILVSNLAKFIKVRRLSPEGFEKEYQALLHKSDEGCIGNNPENKPKNRYKNVVTYDEHRVVLNKQPTEPGADYINATFIDGYKKENAFIASQGPNKASLDDFWQMVYEQRTATIVMLTNLVENSKIKCLEYWPGPTKHQEYGDLEVTGREVEYHGSYVLRKFGVGKPGRSPHQVSQYHYTIWPDMGVPDSSQPVIDFRDVVKTANPTDAGPIIVHCSAGAGRTGTFITIDSMMEMIDAEQKIDVFKFVNEMRKRRAYMVQVKPQYEFIYETLLQWSMCERVSFNIIDLPATVKSWRTEDATTGKTEMSTQFEVLEYMAPKESIGSNQRGSMLENSKKNRYPDLVPVDKFQPLLMTTGDGVDDNEYINASFFDVKGRTNAHVCAQCPLMSTIGDFWRLIWDYDIHTVIHLNEMDSTCGQYWPDDDKTNFGSFTIELLSSKKLTETLIERELKVTTPKKKGERKISQFQYTGWPKDLLVPSSKMEFLELLMQVDNNNASEKRFLIVCMDGVGASPTCLAAIAAMEKTKEDKTVDVFSAVKRLRKSRPGVVDKLERYNFCFDVLAAYQDSVQTYANYM